MYVDRFRYYTDWHRTANQKHYDAPADPWELLSVDPTAVEYYTSDIKLNWGLGRITAGDWDHNPKCNRIDETPTYQGLIQWFEHGYDWEDTVQFQRAKAHFETEGSFRGYESLEEYKTVRCAHVDDLFQLIKQDGYRPNNAATHDSPTDDNPFETAYANQLEPLVAIGRTGEIYWAEGYHRLIIASILDLDEIPVYVLCRHEHWQYIRDQVHNASSTDELLVSNELLDHPDLQDLLI